MKWALAIIGAAILTSIVGIFFENPLERRFNRTFLDKAPDVHIWVYGYEHSYTLHQLGYPNLGMLEITFLPVRFPNGVDTIDPSVTLMGVNWQRQGMEGKKMFVVAAENRGEGVARNVKIDVEVTPYLVDTVTINKPNRMEIIGGGYSGSYVTVLAKELTPGEKQYFEVTTAAKDLTSISAQTNDNHIDNIFIFDVLMTPRVIREVVD